MTILKIKRIDNNALLPTYAHTGDAGLDIYAVNETVILPGRTALIKTGLELELPPQTEAQVRPRSGLALKHSITVLNTPGTIDEGYRGEIGVILINHGQDCFHVTPGMRIAQLVIKPILTVHVVEVDVLNDSDRGSGGYGSSGT